jgi:UDPglucose 6-dehydrogenase
MHLTVFGTGFVGLVTGSCLADFGMLVTCVDVDEAKIRALQQGELPIYEPGLEEVVKRNVASKRLIFSADLKKAVKGSLVLFVAVGTESRPDGRANLDHVRSVAETIGATMEEYKVVVIKSTVPVGTAHQVAEWVRGAQKAAVDFDVVSNPEFLREGAAVEDFMRPNRVVLGADNPRALAIVKDIYRPLYLIETPFVVTDNCTAELIKYANNSFLAIKISFINEVARLCDRTGSDVHVIARALGLDGRIGRKFLHPGPGWGGSCFPKDTRAFVRVFEDYGVENRMVRASIEVNDEQPGHVLATLEKALGTLQGARVALLGLSYKPNTNDVRESPAIRLANAAIEAGAKVIAFDPVAIATAKAVLKKPNLEFAANAYAAAKNADALVLATEWNEFRNLDMARVRSEMKGNVILDARNVYDPVTLTQIGFHYIGVGRPAPAKAQPAPHPVSRPRARAAKQAR